MMAIADIFEALTAQDRPYKSGKKLSDAMKIMGMMKADQSHRPRRLFDLFVKAGVYKDCALLAGQLIDMVDEGGAHQDSTEAAIDEAIGAGYA